MRLRRAADLLVERVRRGEIAFSGMLNESKRYQQPAAAAAHMHHHHGAHRAHTYLIQNAADGGFAVDDGREKRLKRFPSAALARSHFLSDSNLYQLEIDHNLSVVSGVPTEEFILSGAVNWQSLRELALSATGASPDAALAGRASSLVAFRRANRFCSRCGTPYPNPNLGKSTSDPSLVCASCGLTKWPRANPCALVLVTSGDEKSILLGRGVKWITGRFSTLAGFCDASESIEHCCVREVREEAGVAVDPDSVLMAASQPWPVSGLVQPNTEPGVSLMVSCFAKALDANPVVTPDSLELEEARFFSSEEIRECLRREREGGSTRKAGVTLPPRGAISRGMIESWIDSE